MKKDKQFELQNQIILMNNLIIIKIKIKYHFTKTDINQINTYNLEINIFLKMKKKLLNIIKRNIIREIQKIY